MCSTDEELAAAVRRYPVLYDKADSDFHRKDLKINAWNAISDELRFEDGEHARKAFLKLRDRYARTRKASKRSQGSDNAAKKAKEKLTHLQFMEWLDDHIRQRKSKTNVPVDNLQFPISSPLHRKNHIELDKDIAKETETTEPKEINEVNKTHLVKETERKQNREGINDTTEPIDDQKKTSILRSCSSMQADEFDFFGQYVARKMRKLKQILHDDALETVEYDITIILMKALSNNLNNRASNKT